MTPIEVVNERHTGAKGECGHFVAHSLLLAEGESGLPRESILSYDLSVIRPICHAPRLSWIMQTPCCHFRRFSVSLLEMNFLLDWPY